MEGKIEIIGVKLPLVRVGDDVAELIVKYAEGCGGIRDGDVLVVAEKVVSKALGLTVDLALIKPSKKALKISKATGLDPRFVELVLKECDRVLLTVPIKELVKAGMADLASITGYREAAEKLLDEYPCFFIVERDRMVWSDSGVDSSNVPAGKYVTPLRNHDEVARVLCKRIMELTGKHVAVVISDTEVFLGGSMDFARGSWGIDPVDRLFGFPDLYGKPKYGGADLIAHEVCSAAALILKQSGEGVPVAIIRGLKYRRLEQGLRASLPHIDLEGTLALTARATMKALGVWATVKLLLRALIRMIQPSRFWRLPSASNCGSKPLRRGSPTCWLNLAEKG